MRKLWFWLGLSSPFGGRCTCASAQLPLHATAAHNPPGPPHDPRVRAVRRRAGGPEPVLEFATPYDVNYTNLIEYNGAARDVPEPTQNVTEVRIGFLGPI